MNDDAVQPIDKKTLRHRVETEPDFINSKKYKYSYSAFVDRNSSNRNNDKLICILLVLDPEELSRMWKAIIEKGRRYFGLDVE